jgi:branched-subunit amino acid aminotransferase/4-amino-4-deoxychorismate lyase
MCWERESPYYDNILKKKSLKLQISSLVKPASDYFSYSANASGLYILNHVAKKQAINNGYDDALLLDYRGYIAEATTANFFIVKNNNLITPTTDCCLDGITRQLIIEIARQNDIDVNIRHITRDELGDVDEVFPIQYIQDCIEIKGGSHIMILNKFKWFNENLPKIILENTEVN